MQAVGGANGHTSGLESSVHAVFTIVAFDHLAGLLVPLGRPPRASRHAGFAAHAEVFVNKDNPVLRAFLHGAGRAGRHTPGVFTMKTGHEGEKGAGQGTNEFGTNGHNLTELWADRQIFVALASHLATMTTDAFLAVLEQIMFTHNHDLHLAIRNFN